MYEHPTIMMMLGTQLNFMEVGLGGSTQVSRQRAGRFQIVVDAPEVVSRAA